MKGKIILGKTTNVNKNSITENVYYTIKENIMNWNLKPGNRISEKEVSELLNVSRTPVRESFIRLSKDGLLEILPQRGSFISKIDLKEVEEGLFIRKSLETSVLKKASFLLENTDYNELEEIIIKQKEALKIRGYDEFSDYDQEFHKLIYRKTEKMKTWEVIQSVNTQYNRVRILTLLNIDKFSKLISEHEQLLKALNKKDERLIEETISDHLEKLFIEEKILKEKYPEYFL